MYKKLFLIVIVLLLFSCAPFDKYYYSIEYEYAGKEDPANLKSRIEYVYTKDNKDLIDYAYKYDGNSPTPSMFIVYEYWNTSRIDIMLVNDRIYKVEYYTSDNIFESDADKDKRACKREKKKNIEEVTSKQLKYDNYSIDLTSGRITGKTSYYYNSADPNPDNRDVPMVAIDYKFEWKWPHQVFNKYGEQHKIYLNEKWIVTKFVACKEEFINGAMRLKYKKMYINNISDYGPAGIENFDKIESYEYYPNGTVERISTFTFDEFKKGESGVAEKIIVYKRKES